MTPIALTPSTDPKEVARRYADTGTLAGVRIPDSASVYALRRIAEIHARLDHGECVLELVVAHPAADDALLSEVVALVPDSSQVASAIAMSDRASEALLRQLLAFPSPGVRDHVEMALLERELQAIDPAAFGAVLARYRDDASLSYGVRHRIATHPRTPTDVLATIAAHDDATGQAARDRLAPRVPPVSG